MTLTNFSPSRFSCDGYDSDNSSSSELYVQERGRRSVDCSFSGVQYEADVWPVEHPQEPQDDDRPVQCPMPSSSVLNRSLRKQERARLQAIVKREGNAVAASEVPRRAVRKRPHVSTNRDHAVEEAPRASVSLPLPPSLLSRNLNIPPFYKNNFERF